MIRANVLCIPLEAPETCMVKEISMKTVKPCQFPFVYRNRTFHGCTTWRSDTRESFLWCSTRTSAHDNKHVKGSNFGACTADCLTHEKGLLLWHKKQAEKSKGQAQTAQGRFMIDWNWNVTSPSYGQFGCNNFHKNF